MEVRHIGLMIDPISDDHAVGRMAGDFLLGRGFENFAFVRRQRPTRFARERGTGFRTASALVNLFRQRFGMTPREYRIANRR